MALTVRAIHTFVAEHGDELDFHAGDDIVVLEKDEAFGDGWWRGRNTKGEEGLFPATYISESQPAVDEDLNAKDAKDDVNDVNGNEPAPPAAIPAPKDDAPLPEGDDPTPGGWPADNLAVPPISLPDQSPKGTTTVDAQGGILESAMPATGIGAAAANVGNVMHRTIGDIQDAIESYARPESDDEHEQEELGIGQDARAKLVEQARLANEKRERDETGFVYSDESEDEEEDFGKSLPLVTKSRTSIGTESQGMNGFHDIVKEEEMAPAAPKPIETEPAVIPAPVVATSTAAATAAAAATDAPLTPSLEPKPELTPLVPSSSEQREPSVGTLQPAFIPATPPLVQTPPAQAPAATTPSAATPSAQAPSSASNRSPSIPAKPVTTWTVDDVVSWAQAKSFDEEHEISGDVLLELDANLLKELDIIAFGKRMRIAAAISELRRPSSMISSSSQQFSPSGLPTHMSPGVSLRGMSAPPSSSSYGMGMAQPTFPSTPPLSTPPMPSHSEEPEPGTYSAWAHHPKKHGAPVMEAINEKPHPQPDAQTQPDAQPETQTVANKAASNRSSQPPPSNTAPSSIRPASTTTAATAATAASMPVSPITPGSGSTVTKRESLGSLGAAGGGGHKRGKQSVDSSKDRLSFFGRNRKPAPLGAAVSPAAATGTATGEQTRSTSSRLGFGSSKVHQMQPASPQNKYISGPTAGAGAGAAGAAGGGALKQIGTPDYAGYLKKKGERYGGWKTRYVVLKGSTLYILKTDNADSLKDRIDLHAHRIMVDDNTNPGSYGFRLAPSQGGNATTAAAAAATGGAKSHSFSASEQTVVRGWMKALLKATIARDYTKPITSSCNIPTIPLAEAQALAPRPPSPTTREAMQRATRRENPNQLTPHDANILMSLDTSSGEKRRASQNLGVGTSPARPSRDMRRPSSNFSQNTQKPASSAPPPPVPAPALLAAGRSQNSGDAPSDIEAPQLLEWVNTHLPPACPRATALPQSFTSGETIFFLVKSLSGVEPNPPVAPGAFQPEADGLPGLDGLIAMMDMLVDAGVKIDGISINEVRMGDTNGMVRLLKSVQDWYESGQAGAQS
ncbi:hypothetical protein D1P53_001953 [Cryptococcus gattii VGV]|nr:hypothetical protein D1P53_001953 [Cryptococcus gattii VGV]